MTVWAKFSGLFSDMIFRIVFRQFLTMLRFGFNPGIDVLRFC